MVQNLLSLLDLGIHEAKDLVHAKSASLETNVFAQHYALIVVHDTTGLDWHICVLFPVRCLAAGRVRAI